MKEYEITVPGTDIRLTNEYFVDDSFSFDMSTNSTGHLLFGTRNEKTILKFQRFYINTYDTPHLAGKTIKVKYTEDEVVHDLGNYYVSSEDYGDYVEHIITVTAYSERASYDNNSKIFKKLENYIRKIAPYKNVVPSFMKLPFRSCQFVLPIFKIKGMTYARFTEHLYTEYLNIGYSTVIYSGEYKFTFTYRGVLDTQYKCAYIKYHCGNSGAFSDDMVRLRTRYGSSTNFDNYMWFMCEQFENEGSSGSISASFPVIINYIYDVNGNIDTSIIPLRMSLITGWKIVVEKNGAVIETVDNQNGYLYSDNTSAVYTADIDSVSGVIDLTKADIDNLEDYMVGLASGSVECSCKTLKTIDNVTYLNEYINYRTDYLTPSSDLVPSATLTPNGCSSFVSADVISMEEMDIKKFGIIKGSFTDAEGGNHTFVRRLRKNNTQISWDSVSTDCTYSGGVATIIINKKLTSDKIRISNIPSDAKVYGYDLNIFGEYANKRLLLAPNSIRYGGATYGDVEDSSVHNIRKIEIETGSSSTNHNVYERNENSYNENTYKENDNINTYELNNELLSAGVIDSHIVCGIMDNLEEKLKSYLFENSKVTLVNNFKVKPGELVEINVRYNNYIIMVDKITSSGGVLLIDTFN